jgi:uncharacterized membrane protein
MAKEKNISSKRSNVSAKRKNNSPESVWKFPLDKTDLIWILIGIGVVALGFLLMATGVSDEAAVAEGGSWNNFLAINVAPIVILIGYLVIIPMAIMKFFSKRKKAKISDNSDINN